MQDKRIAAKNQQVVLHLFDALRANDRERVLSFFTEETVFQPLARASVRGHDAIWSALNAAIAETELAGYRFGDIVSSNDGRVEAERFERYLVDGIWSERCITEILSVRGAKVTQWRETSARDSSDIGGN
ncbi:MAG TPA: limonene-1,2-epoxide hydrolase family protein [Spongiibacteraceae bacterium]|jgi:limonene-1,2-epoxide hydrolase